MGNDGGTIPRRVELVRERKKPQQKDKDAETAAKWKYCQISQELLRPPIVACDLGRLYNKDSVLLHLLNKKSALEGVEHIKSIKDVTELQLTDASQKSSTALDQGGFHDEARWICPITGLEMTGRQLFSFVKPCGCVISDRALKALKSETCPKCNKPYNDDNVIPINPGPEEMVRLRQRMELLKSQQQAAKQAAKESKKRALSDQVQDATAGEPVTKHSKQSKTTAGASSSKDIGTLRHTLSKDKEVEELAKKSIANDPKSSDVFKSLFTSSDAAQTRDHAHWVTYNPYY